MVRGRERRNPTGSTRSRRVQPPRGPGTVGAARAAQGPSPRRPSAAAPTVPYSNQGVGVAPSFQAFTFPLADGTLGSKASRSASGSPPGTGPTRASAVWRRPDIHRPRAATSPKGSRRERGLDLRADHGRRGRPAEWARGSVLADPRQPAEHLRQKPRGQSGSRDTAGRGSPSRGAGRRTRGLVRPRRQRHVLRPGLRAAGAGAAAAAPASSTAAASSSPSPASA